jgi:hypothetical protein
MKHLLTIILLLSYLGLLKSQTAAQPTLVESPEVAFKIKPIAIPASNPVAYRTDSTDLMLLLKFKHLNTDVKEVYIKILSDTSGNALTINQNIKVETINDVFTILGGKAFPFQIKGTNRLAFDARIKRLPSNNFFSIAYLNKQNSLSPTKYYKLN